jgi:hypothetical protein
MISGAFHDYMLFLIRLTIPADVGLVAVFTSIV